MKIAILGIKGVPGRHGVEVVVDSLIEPLASLGHDITVYGYDSYAQPSDGYRGARIRTVPGSASKNLEMASHMWNAALDSRRRGFDVVHIHSADPCLFAWIPSPRLGIVATSHGQAYLRRKWGAAARIFSMAAERFFIRLPRARTCVSKPLCEYYERKYRRQVHYIPNGITIREAPPPSLLAPLGLEPGSYLFSSAGRIERTKGLSTLIEAYRRLGAKLPLVIAGGGSATDEAYFAELKRTKPDGVVFAGFLTGDSYYALYAHARLFVFPSEYEAMSMALLEGLSFGVPTVYSDTPENEAVASGIAAPFRTGDAASLAETIARILDRPAESAAIARCARETVAARHDWRAIARQYDAIYRSLEDCRG